MGFVTPALLAGAALIAVPIVLHLIMRREAQRIKFPALRFVQQRRQQNQTRLQLRHWLLLALRCAIVALLAFALARPTLRGSGAAGKAGAPMAAALVFDNSIRMQYEQDDKTRLAKAKELGTWLISQLPPECPVTVVDRAGRQRGQDLDRDAADLRIERMELGSAVRPMSDAVGDALRWLGTKKDYRGEVYIFTDMSAEAWSEDTLASFTKALNEQAGTNVYLIDVGAAEPRNIGLGKLKLSSERVAPGGLLQLTTDLSAASGKEGVNETTVELFVGDGNGKPEKRGQQVVKVSPGGPSPIEFSLSGLKLGTHQGMVRIVGRDGLSADDVRYFTVDVQPPSKVLLLADKTSDALFVREALQPSSSSELVQSKFVCTVGTFDKLKDTQLSDYSAVLLLDPPPLPNDQWQPLANFVDSGGGVGIFLGRHARREELNGAEAQKLLPGKLRWQSREPTYLRPIAVEHPALRELGDLADTAPWSEFPVFKYWELEAGAQPAQVVATFANGKPAIVERQIGAGSVVVMTTSISDSANDDPWNLLPTGPEPWPFLALINGVVQHLAGAGRTQLNYLAGQTIVLPLSAEQQVPSFVLQLPDGSAVRQSITSGQRTLSIPSAEMLGNYRVRAGGQQDRLDRGFSVNAPAEMTRLERVPAADVVKALGNERTRVATNRDEIALRVGIGRVGRELFPILILAVALAMALEQLLANRFYSSEAGAASRKKTGLDADMLKADDAAELPTELPTSLPLSTSRR